MLGREKRKRFKITMKRTPTSTHFLLLRKRKKKEGPPSWHWRNGQCNEKKLMLFSGSRRKKKKEKRGVCQREAIATKPTSEAVICNKLSQGKRKRKGKGERKKVVASLVRWGKEEAVGNKTS